MPLMLLLLILLTSSFFVYPAYLSHLSILHLLCLVFGWSYSFVRSFARSSKAAGGSPAVASSRLIDRRLAILLPSTTPPPSTSGLYLWSLWGFSAYLLLPIAWNQHHLNCAKQLNCFVSQPAISVGYILPLELFFLLPSKSTSLRNICFCSPDSGKLR